ncbi:MAG: hypothetical protein P1U37_06560 [Minwuia sp.]|nr:hypothetical protein [Minwuia sp.]
MIRLGMSSDPYWIDLVDGVRVRVRPCDTAVYQAAKLAGINAVRDAQQALAGVRDAGGTVMGLSLDDAAEIAGVSQFGLVKALARLAILEWEGVGDDDGNVLPVTAANVEGLMRYHDIADIFVSKYTAPYADRVREGNGSGPSPNGTSATGPNTAPDAGKAVPPVLTESPV